MQRRAFPRISAAVWTMAILAVAWLSFGDRLLTHWAYAVERGRILASEAELARLHEEVPEMHAVSQAFRLVSKIAGPGVVYIEVAGGEEPEDINPEDIPEEMRDVPPEQLRHWQRRTAALGSGIIIDTDGYILTNNHVVEGRDQITVTLQDDRQYDAQIVGTDPKTDLAVVKIDAPDLNPLRFGDSSKVDVGDWVLAVGAPFGQSQTVTHGIVSATGRGGVGVGIYYQDFIQTDAAINPGNSGGPLLNLHGEVIGVNTAIATHGDAYNAGVAFTIPSNLAAKVSNELKAFGTVRRGWLGILHTPIASEEVAIFSLPSNHGTLVAGVLPGSPAADGGLQVEDAIMAVNGQTFETTNQFQQLIADLVPNEVATFDVIRDGKPLKVDVRLGLQPDEMWRAQATPAVESRQIQPLGLGVTTLRAPQIRQGIWRAFRPEQRGVCVVELTNRRDIDVKPGELIVACNGRQVENVFDLTDALKSSPVGANVRLQVLQANGDRRMITVRRRAAD